jgi:hypothetical protein
MICHEPPAIQNSTQACFYCNSKLADAEPLEIWEVDSGERFIKVRCSNQQCGSAAWRPDSAQSQKSKT